MNKLISNGQLLLVFLIAITAFNESYAFGPKRSQYRGSSAYGRSARATTRYSQRTVRTTPKNNPVKTASKLDNTSYMSSSKSSTSNSKYGGEITSSGSIELNNTSKQTSASAVQNLTHRFDRKMRRSQYMNKGCSTTTGYGNRAGVNWSGVKVKKCSYKALGLKANVAMVLPTTNQYAKWVVEACAYRRRNNYSCQRKLMNRIIMASGGMFAINGSVVENLGKGPKRYPFKNGVTASSRAKYGRPVSVTRAQLVRYCKASNACPYKSQRRIASNTAYAKAIGYLFKAGIGKNVNHVVRAGLY